MVSRAPALIDTLQALPECRSMTFEERFSETKVSGDDRVEVPWQWPAR